MWIIINRTIITYIFIVFFFRLMGKREIGELSLLDIVISIMMAEIAIFVIEDPNKHMFTSLIPMFVLVIIQRLSAFISLKSKRFRSWFEGVPSVMVMNGKINKEEMKDNRYNIDDLIQQMHEKSVKCIRDIEYAILEPAGTLTVFAKEKPISKGFVHLLVADGKIQKKVLKRMGKTEQWLKDNLKEQGYSRVDEIFYCTLDEANQWFIDE